jgi:hypothetical protein
LPDQTFKDLDLPELQGYRVLLDTRVSQIKPGFVFIGHVAHGLTLELAKL